VTQLDVINKLEHRTPICDGRCTPHTPHTTNSMHVSTMTLRCHQTLPQAAQSTTVMLMLNLGHIGTKLFVATRIATGTMIQKKNWKFENRERELAP